MNGSGEVADLMVREGIQITESAAKLAGLGAKNLAAIVIALLNEDNKLQGKTALKKLLKADKPLCILQINKQELKKFQSEAKRYGVLFTVVTDKTSGFCDIIAKQDDVVKLNYIIEKLGLNAPVVAIFAVLFALVNYWLITIFATPLAFKYTPVGAKLFLSPSRK